MSKRGKRKANTPPEVYKEQDIAQSTVFGARLVLTAATITLAETWGWPEEWIAEWTRRTMATALVITEDLDPSSQTRDELEEALNDPNRLHEYLNQRTRELEKT
jgi:hypothetical protein